MDIYDQGLIGAGATRGTGADTPTNPDAPKTELDQNVEKLVGNISNWWSGIAKKSQESIQQARQQVESQGGIVNYAKSEYAKLESTISDAQKRAREQSVNAEVPEVTASEKTNDGQDQDPTLTSSSKADKGKQRAIDVQDDAAAESQKTASDGPTLSTSVSSLFTKLTQDPRLASLQKSLTNTLQTISSPQPQLNEDGTPRTATVVGGTATNLQESLSKLSLTIQSHLPHLDLKESQQLATKYLHATENFAKEIQTDMKDFVGELVRIVPPESDEKASTAAAITTQGGGEKGVVADTKTQSAQQGGIVASESTKSLTKSKDSVTPTEKVNPAATGSTAEDEDFAWDEEDEEAVADAAKSATKTATSSSKSEKAGVQKDVVPEKPKPRVAEKEDPQTKKNVTHDDDDDEDSDWE